MTELVLVRYLHFIFLFVMVSCVATQHLMIKKEMSRSEITRLSRIDMVYGISALLVVAVGLTLWFGVGKPKEFYSKNWVFHTKITLFVIVGLLSIIPTRFFSKHRKGNPEEMVSIPAGIKRTIQIELLLLFLIPLLATLMAQGIGFFG